MQDFNIDPKNFRENLIITLNEFGIKVEQTPNVDCECYIFCKDVMLLNNTIEEVIRYIPIQTFINDMLINVINEFVDEIMSKKYSKICIFLPKIVQYNDDDSKKIIFKIMIQDLNN